MRGPRRPRVDRLGPLIHPTVRFLWGLVLLGCLVFAASWQARGLLAGLALGLALASGKRVSPAYFLMLMASIVLFNLLLPVGRVWFRVGSLAITEGAFYLGLGKGFTFTGLVFVSLTSISRRLALPGRFGALWGRTFSWYEQLMDQRAAIRPRALLLSLDRLLERLYPTRGEPNAAPQAGPAVPLPPTSAAGWVLVLGTGLAAAALTVGWR